MKTWMSKWLIFVSAGHSIVGIILFGNVYMEMISQGLIGSVNSEITAAATWFLLFGFLLFITSILLSVIEKSDVLTIPNSVNISLFMLTTLGVILMPASGFWLVYPVIIGIFFKNNKARQNIQ